MACSTQFVPAMASTQVARAVRVEEARNSHFELLFERAPLRANWVAVTENGNQIFEMRWTLAADDR